VLNGSKLGLVKPIQTLGLTLGRGISSDGLCRLWDYLLLAVQTLGLTLGRGISSDKLGLAAQSN
jgi:hypothetical protein